MQTAGFNCAELGEQPVQNSVPLESIQEIYCFLDNDDAGRKAVDLLREMNTATVYNMMEAFSYYKDVNDLLRDKKRMP